MGGGALANLSFFEHDGVILLVIDSKVRPLIFSSWVLASVPNPCGTHHAWVEGLPRPLEDLPRIQVPLGKALIGVESFD